MGQDAQERRIDQDDERGRGRIGTKRGRKEDHGERPRAAPDKTADDGRQEYERRSHQPDVKQEIAELCYEIRAGVDRAEEEDFRIFRVDDGIPELQENGKGHHHHRVGEHQERVHERRRMGRQTHRHPSAHHRIKNSASQDG